MAEPTEDQDPAAGFQADLTGEEVMELLAAAGTALQPGQAATPTQGAKADAALTLLAAAYGAR